MRRLVGPVLVLLVGAVSALSIWVPDSVAAAGAPQISVSSTSNPLRHGSGVSLSYTGLQPGASYTVSSVHGVFDFAWTKHSFDFTASATGAFSDGVNLPSSDPADGVELDLTETGQTAVLASLTIPAAPPTLNVTDPACPGRSTVVTGLGFVDGSYLLHTDAGTLSPTPAQLYRGSLTSAKLTLPNSVTPFTVTVTLDGDASPTASRQFAFRAGYLNLTSSSPWQGTAVGQCFAPGEQVNLTSSAGIQLPSSAAADSSGNLSVAATLRPGQQVGRYASISATGQTSQQHGTASTIVIASNTLLPNNGLGSSQLLASDSPGYTFDPGRCDAAIEQVSAAGVHTVWSARPATTATTNPIGCVGYLDPSGDFVLYSPSGVAVWATNTAGAGNRLVLQNTGILQLLSSTGAVLWSSAIVPSYAFLTGSRTGSAVYVNGLIKQRSPTSELIRSPARTVYLQRFLGGSWQNVLSRVTDGLGQIAVGFVQAKPYSYRLVVPPAAAKTATSSNTVLK